MLLTRKKVLAAKVETTPGSAESLTASEAAFNVFGADIQPRFDFLHRESQESFSPLAGVATPAIGTVSFSMELYGNGGGTNPWAPVFLPACGFYLDSTTYKLKSEGPGSNVKTLTLGLYQDGLFKSIYGAAGNVRFNMVNGRIATADFTFTGVFATPSDVALITPDYPENTPIKFNSATVSIGSTWGTGSANLIASRVGIDVGNQVVMREDVHKTSGFAHAIITNRLVTGEIDPESTLIATHNIWSEITAGTQGALSVILGGTGNLVTFSAPKLQFSNIRYGNRGDICVDELTFVLNRNLGTGGDRGDDELTISFAG